MSMQRAALVLILLSTALASCANRPGWRRTVAEQPIAILVENQNFNDATVYALVHSQRVRLGQVGGHSTGAFEIATAPTEMRFIIDLLASSHFTTHGISVGPGDAVQLVITADVRSSRVYR